MALLAVALGYVEASVVVYLRHGLAPVRRRHFPQRVEEPIPLLDREQLGGSEGSAAKLVGFEAFREVAAITVLVAAAYGFHRQRGQALGLFLLGFALWDVFYYVFLKALIGWPASLAAWDVLFLIPAPWVAPVWAPLVISGTLLVIAAALLARRRAGPQPARRTLAGGAIILAGLTLVLASFFLRAGEAMGGVPRQFDWPLFLAGWVVGVAGVVWLLSRPSAVRR